MAQDRTRDRAQDKSRGRAWDKLRDRAQSETHDKAQDESCDRVQDEPCDRAQDRTRDKNRDRKERLAAFLSAAGIAALLSFALWTYFFTTPCRVEEDCRGMEVDEAQIRSWEEQERENPSGILLDTAGWRVGDQQAVSAVSTGRQKTSSVLEVCGSAALVFPVKILSGDYALPYEAESGGDGTRDASSQTPETAAGTVSRNPPACILTKELSDALFGSTDSAGETVKVGDEVLTVAGVIDKEGFCLLKSAAGGRMDYVAFRMRRHYQARALARQLIEGGA